MNRRLVTTLCLTLGLLVPALGQEITLTSRQQKTLQPQTMALQSRVVQYPLAVPGVCQPAPGHVAAISAPLSGRLHGIRAHEGSRVKKGDILVEMESMELATLVAEYLKTRGQEQYLSRRMERIRQLVEKRISPQGTLEQLESERKVVMTTLQALSAQLQTIGYDQQALNLQPNQPIPGLKLRAPIDGVIIAAQVIEGGAVDPHQELFTILNPDHLTVKGFVAPEDATPLRPGQKVTILKMQNQNIHIQGQLDSINPSLDPSNRAIAVLTRITPQDSWPSVGEPVRMVIDITTPKPLIAIPDKAVFTNGEQTAVFLETGPGRFRVAPVTVQPLAGGMLQLLEGPPPGSRIATSDIFTLKALIRVSEYGEE